MPHDDQFQVHTGEMFYARRWPVEAARGTVVIIHGYGEHCARYDTVAARLNGLGLEIHSYDQRGHGRSPGKRGHIRRFPLLVQDLRAFLQSLGGDIAGKPLFLLGHSMGGLVLANYCIQFQPQAAGLIFSSPFLLLNVDVSPMLVRLSDLLSVLMPWLPVARVNPEYLSRDSNVCSTYRADPFVYHGAINARTGAELNHAIEAAGARLGEIRLPLHIIHGLADRLVNPAGSELLHERAGATDKELRMYPGAYHELFNEIEEVDALAGLAAWLEPRLEPAASESQS